MNRFQIAADLGVTDVIVGFRNPYVERVDSQTLQEKIDHLRRYVVAHGTSNPHQHDVIDGFAIGQWVANRRVDYRKGRLSAERITLFENEFADWLWNPQDAASTAAFEAGVAHLLRYRAVHGTSNPRQPEVIDGFAIGQWAANRRSDYRAGRLSADRVRRCVIRVGRMRVSQ